MLNLLVVITFEKHLVPFVSLLTYGKRWLVLSLGYHLFGPNELLHLVVVWARSPIVVEVFTLLSDMVYGLL